MSSHIPPFICSAFDKMTSESPLSTQPVPKSQMTAHSSGQEESLARKMPEKVLEGAAEEIGGKGVDAALQNDYIQNAQEEAKIKGMISGRRRCGKTRSEMGLNSFTGRKTWWRLQEKQASKIRLSLGDRSNDILSWLSEQRSSKQGT
ncbi:hypothetical protein EDD85DRAFT_941957 [Armillaria nabsnona]|nr:hypothetical protein EDD85DRAFT_941957 [Armillaria nabsnona]